MHTALIFLIGMTVGGVFGVVIMCLLQIGRDEEEYEDEHQEH